MEQLYSALAHINAAIQDAKSDPSSYAARDLDIAYRAWGGMVKAVKAAPYCLSAWIAYQECTDILEESFKLLLSGYAIAADKQEN